MKPADFERTIDQAQVVAAIAAAEARTSGEIRVVVSVREVADAVRTAQQEFVRLGMADTRERNAVLIFIAPRSQRLAVIGDEGVHRRCGESFWTEVVHAMEEHFRAGDFTRGLVQAVERTGTLLAAHFPRRGDDANELPDAVERV